MSNAEVFGDRLEIDTLVGLENKRAYLTRSQRQLNDIKGSINAIANYGESNGVAATATPTTDESDAGIENRRTVINYYPQTTTTSPTSTPTPTPTPQSSKTGISPWWLLVPLALALLAIPLIWRLAQPSPTPHQPGEAAQTTIKLGDAP